jgi:ribonuclease P protein component
MIGRIQRSADFERVLGSPSRARSAHFAVHHLADRPSRVGQKLPTGETKLSTAAPPGIHMLVDDGQRSSAATGPAALMPAVALERLWLGCVVPKRNARRSVTRALIKRQIRAVFAATAAAGLAQGLWVVRLRAPFDPRQFPSAASDALRATVRLELQELVAKLLRRQDAQAVAGASSA